MNRADVCKKNPPEIKLFLELLKSFIRKAKVSPDALPPEGPMDWGQFKELSVYHELCPFIFSAIKEASLPVPEDLEKFLTQNYYAVLIKTQSFWREFLAIVNVFREKNVALVPLKGIASLADIYRDSPFRPMTHIDIFVKEEELAKAREILSVLGYKARPGELKEDSGLKEHCQLTFIKEDQNGGEILDVHFALDFRHSHFSGLMLLWERIREVSVDEYAIRLLSPEDRLFSLALQQRRFGGKAFCLKNVFDLAMILERYGSGFDWDYVIREARAGEMRATVFFLLAQAKTFFDSAVPEDVWKGLEIPHHQRRKAETFIKDRVLFPCGREENRGLFLKTQFLIFDGFWESASYIFNAPPEQFAKYYDLRSYAKATERLYWLRLFYVPYRFILGKVGFKFKKT